MSSSYIHLLLIIVILLNSLLLGGTLRKEETLISNWSATLEGLSVGHPKAWHLHGRGICLIRHVRYAGCLDVGMGTRERKFEYWALHPVLEQALITPGSNEHYEGKQWLFYQVSDQGPYLGAVDQYITKIRRVSGVLNRVLEHKDNLTGVKFSYAIASFVTDTQS
ncbi:uncharacterized protein RSE6_13511 [Rhynchosporium secalis]|uniref:Uncharacterized protein n=1 Tax=Rhynchosporium secalis TaxID=38038 RepID=A0A1E1MT26_RHYSE|nr:uncharacterized protein RSE6_13511 [Rhynchosporium secalis]